MDWTLLSFSYTIVWCCCCWLGTVSLSINLCVLQPKTPRERLGFLGFSLQCFVGDLFSLFPGGSYNRPPLVRSQLHQMHLMHPTWFDTALHRWRKTTGEHATTISVLLKRFLGSKVSRLLSSNMELPLVPFSVVPGPHWPRPEWWCFWDTGHYDHLGRQEGHCKVLWHSQLGRWPWNDLNAWPFFWRRGLE